MSSPPPSQSVGNGQHHQRCCRLFCRDWSLRCDKRCGPATPAIGSERRASLNLKAFGSRSRSASDASVATVGPCNHRPAARPTPCRLAALCPWQRARIPKPGRVRWPEPPGLAAGSRTRGEAPEECGAWAGPDRAASGIVTQFRYYLANATGPDWFEMRLIPISLRGRYAMSVQQNRPRPRLDGYFGIRIGCSHDSGGFRVLGSDCGRCDRHGIHRADVPQAALQAISAGDREWRCHG